MRVVRIYKPWAGGGGVGGAGVQTVRSTHMVGCKQPTAQGLLSLVGGWWGACKAFACAYFVRTISLHAGLLC